VSMMKTVTALRVNQEKVFGDPGQAQAGFAGAYSRKISAYAVVIWNVLVTGVLNLS
jgi:hypothetical protein